MKLTNKTYDILKWIALILLPATATFIGAVGGYVKWEYTEDEFKKIIAEFKERGFNPENIQDTTKKVDINQLVEDIALGQNGWFNVFGEERKKKIEALGLDFDIIQNKVDEYVEEHFE